MTAAVLAHQGGWDEAVLVVLPLVVLAGLLRLARRRALQEAEEEEKGPAGLGTAPGGDGSAHSDTPPGG